MAREISMHDMYRVPSGDDLEQGDIVEKRTLAPAMIGHQDYMEQRPDFEAFCVLTQTCDLTSKKLIQTEFITLAVVRKITNIFDQSQARLNRTSERLKEIIQHRANTRFFYLYPEPAAGINDDSVVDMRVTFALHRHHYNQIVCARKMSMNPLYTAHLGWMIGNVFSRIAMPEWGGKELPKLEDKIKSLQDAIEQHGVPPERLEKPISSQSNPIRATASV
jgi:hypothetical protein